MGSGNTKTAEALSRSQQLEPLSKDTIANPGDPLTGRIEVLVKSSQFPRTNPADKPKGKQQAQSFENPLFESRFSHKPREEHNGGLGNDPSNLDSPNPYLPGSPDISSGKSSKKSWPTNRLESKEHWKSKETNQRGLVKKIPLASIDPCSKVLDTDHLQTPISDFSQPKEEFRLLPLQTFNLDFNQHQKLRKNQIQIGTQISKDSTNVVLSNIDVHSNHSDIKGTDSNSSKKQIIIKASSASNGTGSWKSTSRQHKMSSGPEESKGNQLNTIVEESFQSPKKQEKRTFVIKNRPENSLSVEAIKEKRVLERAKSSCYMRMDPITDQKGGTSVRANTPNSGLEKEHEDRKLEISKMKGFNSSGITIRPRVSSLKNETKKNNNFFNPKIDLNESHQLNASRSALNQSKISIAGTDQYCRVVVKTRSSCSSLSRSRPKN